MHMHYSNSKPWNSVEIHFDPGLLTCLADSRSHGWSGSMPPMLLLPSDSSMSLIHLHTITIISLSHCFFLIVKQTHSSKISDVGANPESRLILSIHQLLFSLFPLSYAKHWWGACGNLLPPAYTCWIRESFATFSARCIFSSPANIYHQRNYPL